MLSENEIDYISANLEAFDLVINHQYLPNGYSKVVDDLDKISIRLGNKKLQRGCASCIATLFKDLFKQYEIQMLARTNIQIIAAEVLPKVEAKQKQKKK